MAEALAGLLLRRQYTNLFHKRRCIPIIRLAAYFRLRLREATHHRGMRQRDFADRGSGSRTWHSSVTTILKSASISSSMGHG